MKKASKHPVFRDFLREASGRYRTRTLMVTPADTALSVVTVPHTVPYPPVFSSSAPHIGGAHHTKVLDAQSPNLMSPQQNSQQTAP